MQAQWRNRQSNHNAVMKNLSVETGTLDEFLNFNLQPIRTKKRLKRKDSKEFFTKQTEEKEQVKINEYEVLLSTDDPKERDKAAKILVQKCFERAFGKEFLEDIK